MINKLKAEIEELEKRYEEWRKEGTHKHCFSWEGAILLGKIEVYKECLKWSRMHKRRNKWTAKKT